MGHAQSSLNILTEQVLREWKEDLGLGSASPQVALFQLRNTRGQFYRLLRDRFELIPTLLARIHATCRLHLSGNRFWPSVPAGLRTKGFLRTSTSPLALSENSTTSGGTRPRPRKTSHEIACSARLRGRQIGSCTWSGAGERR